MDVCLSLTLTLTRDMYVYYERCVCNVCVSVWVQVVFLGKCVTVVQYDVLRARCVSIYMKP